MWYWCGKKDVGDRLMHFFFYFRAKEPVRIGFRTFRNIDAFSTAQILETDYRIISRVGHVEARATIGHRDEQTGYICNMREKRV